MLAATMCCSTANVPVFTQENTVTEVGTEAVIMEEEVTEESAVAVRIVIVRGGECMRAMEEII